MTPGSSNITPVVQGAVHPDAAQEIGSLVVMSERLKKLKKEWEEAAPQVYVDDTLLFTESWKATEQMPVDYRWAKAFQKRMEECEILIRDPEIIVGSSTKFIRGNNTLCAVKPREILAMCESGRFDRKLSDISSTVIDPDDLEKLTADAEYWVEHMNPVNYVNVALEEELGREHFDLLFDHAMILEGRGVRENPDRGLFQGYGAMGGGVIMLSGEVLRLGFNHIIGLAKAEMAKMKAEGALEDRASSNALRKWYLLKSMVIMFEAVITFARRHAELAREMAGKTDDPVRKAELEKIADACERVPAEPPRDFWEAVQSVRFMHLAAWKESPERAEVGIGRIDQFWYPYYKADIESGKLTRQQAAELIGAMWLKIREVENLVTIKREHRAAPGSQLPNVTLCGRDQDGNDLTNELSWMILEVMAQIHLSEPAVYVRYHEDQDENFIIHALTCNREFGGGNPAFLNDELGTRRYLDRGVPIEDACNWSASGCLGYHLECAEHMAGAFNLVQAKVMEVTLHDGFDPRTGKQVGPHTGDPRDFTSIEQVYDAFLKQEDYFAEKMRDHYFIWWTSEIANSPMSGLRAGMLFRDCIPAGLASREGGCRYPVGKASWVGDKGVCDCADYVAAIQHLVFDEKKVTMAQLLEAMDANWEGHENLRQLCLKAPKYGNDDDYVDDWYIRLSRDTQKILQSRPDPITGEKPMLFKGAAAGHVTQGKAVGAMPNGRYAGTPIYDGGTSAMAGGDVNGPTALILSATKYDTAYECAGVAHNMKFSKAVLNSPEKLAKVASLIKTFTKRGGWHVQFNIHSAEELVEARKEPAAHKDLLVRVGGYSAYFVDLPPELQDEIVERTMHEVG
jgi:pyruvate-formate lyase